MRHRFIGNSYNRETMVEIFGEKLIDKLERENCEPTSRVMNDEVEFVSCIKAKDVDGNEHYISAYYYQCEEDVRNIEEVEELTWEIDDYGID